MERLSFNNDRAKRDDDYAVFERLATTISQLFPIALVKVRDDEVKVRFFVPNCNRDRVVPRPVTTDSKRTFLPKAYKCTAHVHERALLLQVGEQW